jgi:hypothetical protein
MDATDQHEFLYVKIIRGNPFDPCPSVVALQKRIAANFSTCICANPCILTV